VAALWVAAAVNSLAIGRPAPPAATAVLEPLPTPTSPSAAPPSPAASPDDIEAVVLELQDFVEQHQHLDFTDDVDVQVLDDEAFQRAWRGGGGSAGDDAEALHDTYTALGLVPPGTDRAELQESYEEGVGGFYDFDTGELVVRGASVTPFVRGVLVHELTHALQDQIGDLDSGAEELVDPLDILLEGGARWTEYAYYDSLSAQEQRQYDDEIDRRYGGDSGVPVGLQRLWSLPYDAGPQFFDELVEGGWENLYRLGAAYRSPPPTSEQLLHIEAYEQQELPKNVSYPAFDGSLVRRGGLGEAGLYVVLATQLSEQVAAEAAAGWNGDAYVVWRADGELCARVHIAMDTRAETTELRRALAGYAKKRSGTTVSDNGFVVLTTCVDS
jgi:hypothetical protein